MLDVLCLFSFSSDQLQLHLQPSAVFPKCSIPTDICKVFSSVIFCL